MAGVSTEQKQRSLLMNSINFNNHIHCKIIDKNKSNDPWIIMVHGFSHNSTYFSNQINNFKDMYRILLPDLRGHGKSENIKGPYGVEEYADDIIAVIEESGIKNLHYWGTHTGSAIGLVLAKRNLKFFNSLILEGTFLPGFDMPRLVELINQTQNIAKSEGVEQALNSWLNNSDWFDYMREHPKICRLEEHKSMLFEFTGMPWLSNLSPREVTPVVQHLSEIILPVLVYNGTFDLNDFKKAALCLKNNLPDVKYEEIADAGGFPAWENPTAVNILVHNL